MSSVNVIDSTDWLHFRPSPLEDLVFKLTGDQSENQLELIEVTVRPGGGPPVHVHERQEEVLHILSGSLLFKQGDQLLTLKAGETVFTPRGVPHAYFNQSDQVVTAAGAFTPAGFLDFIRGFQELISGEAPSPDTFKELGARTGVNMVGPPLGVSSAPETL